MWPRDRRLSRCISVIASEAAALLLLASCRNDRVSETKPSETEAREQARTVFGSDSDSKPATSDTRAREAPPVTTNTEPARPSPAAPIRSGRSAVDDRGKGIRTDRRVTAASSRPARESTAERFLYYRPPGARVGDAGELASAEPQPPISTNGIRGIIQRWADTLLAGKLDAHMSLYAPAVRQSIRESKRRMMHVLAGTRRFEIYDLRLQRLRDGSVRAAFRIESDASGGGSYQLDFRQLAGEWKIYRDSSGAAPGLSTRTRESASVRTRRETTRR